MKRSINWIIIIVILIIVIILGVHYLKSVNKPDISGEELNSTQAVVFSEPVKNKAKTFPEVDDIEKDAVKKDIVNTPIVSVNDTEIIENHPVLENAADKAIATYQTPYFTIVYSTKEWEHAEGKNMDLPSYVDVPQKVAVATVQFINKHNNNSIFLHIASSGGADFNKMKDNEVVSYLQFIYNDSRIKNVPVKIINNNKFAVLEFSPRNDSTVLVRQYLTTNDNYLYNITFIENKSEPISTKMVSEILNSIQVKTKDTKTAKFDHDKVIVTVYQ